MENQDARINRRNFLILSVILATASMGCAAMVIVRWILTGRLAHWYLVWNLLLAWVPYLIALLLIPARRARSVRAKRLLVSLIGIAWLVFYPNSPYIFTDMIHVIDRSFLNTGGSDWLTPKSLLWYDLIQNSTFAFIGHFIGLISLSIVHQSVKRAWNKATGWTVSALAIALSGIGIYVGRFLGLNSWDILLNPLKAMSQIRESIFTPRAILFSSGFSFFIASTYLMLYFFRRVDFRDQG